MSLVSLRSKLISQKMIYEPAHEILVFSIFIFAFLIGFSKQQKHGPILEAFVIGLNKQHF